MGDNDFKSSMMLDRDNDDDCIDDEVLQFKSPPINDETALVGWLRIGAAIYKQQAQEIWKKYDDFGRRRLQAEKKLLFTAYQDYSLVEMLEVQKGLSPFTVKTYDRMVNISQVEFHFSPSSTLVRRYCLIVLTSPTQLYVSQFAKANSEGIFKFNINHSIFGLPADWKISMKIHMLSLSGEYRYPWMVNKVAPVWVPADKTIDAIKRPSLFKKYEQFAITPTFQNGRHAILATSSSSTAHKIVFNMFASRYNLL